MSNEQYRIFLIDDEESIRRSISLLLKSAGYAIETFRGADDFFETGIYDGAGCIILDIFLEGKTGLELQKEIQQKFPGLLIIYITGLGDIPMSVDALKKGAINFLQKPIDEKKLFEAVEEALTVSLLKVKTKTETDRFQSLIRSLTTREYEIFQYIITGMLNKQIAAKLNIAEHTVKLHRGKITEKLGVKSVAELVSIAVTLKII